MAWSSHPPNVPNFFIIGAQKCGTDALYDALRRHPQIFMSAEKEPAHFLMDGVLPSFRIPHRGYGRRLTPDWEDYLALFSGATGKQAIGEASAIYLSAYHPDQTAKRLYARVPDARLIALVRQPAERAHAAYHFYHARKIEPYPSFAAALAAEQAGLRDQDCPDVWHWRNGLYAENLRPFLETFPAEQVKVILHDEWRQEPERVLSEVCAFLDVPVCPDLAVRRLNVTTSYHSRTLARFLRAPRWWERPMFHVLPASARRRIDQWNQRPHPPLTPEMRARLTTQYGDSILELQRMIGRDLGHWLATAAEPLVEEETL